MIDLNTPLVKAMAGYSTRTCSGGVLLWNVPNPQNNQPATETTVQVTLKSLPITDFNMEAFIIDDRRFPSVSPSADLQATCLSHISLT